MREEYDPPEKKIEKFWKNTFRKASEEKIMLKDLTLPLARIKRLMKVEEGVRMVASEVPILFSKIAEKFVEELTFRAWINTEENKRRILQRGDISVAVKTSEMYDFLFYIVPRNDISTAFDRMLNTKLMVDNKNIHERSFFENHSHDRFNLGNTRVSDMNQERSITQDFMNPERNATQDFMKQERNTTQDFMKQERNTTQDFMNQERNITQDFMNERHMNTDYPTKPLSQLDFNTSRSIDLNFPRSESGLSLEFANEQQNQEFSKIGFGLEKPFKDL
jgi:histone H3/H4